MKNYPKTLAKQIEEFRSAARQACDAVAQKRHGLSRLVVRSASVRGVEKKLSQAEDFFSQAKPRRAVEEWVKAVDMSIQTLTHLRANFFGKLVIKSKELRHLQQLSSGAHRLKKKWHDGHKKYLRSVLPYFDADHYASQWPKEAGRESEPACHYLQFGWKKHFSPFPLFDVEWYLKENRDVAEGGLEPCAHYGHSGWKEGRNPHALFNVRWYLEQNTDVANEGIEPLAHYLEIGWKEGRNPHPLFNTKWYLQQDPQLAAQGLEPLTHYITKGWREGRDPNPDFSIEQYSRDHDLSLEGKVEPLTHYIEHGWKEDLERELREKEAARVHSSLEILRSRFGRGAEALRIFHSPVPQRRLSLVTDSISVDSLAAGGATGLVMAALLAKRLQCSLRIITRTKAPSPSSFAEVLRVNGIAWDQDVDFVFANVEVDHHCVNFTHDDLFITTSWWITKSVLRSVERSRIIYLVQEDERLLYPEGDEKLRCQDLLSETGVSMVVNSQLLHCHLVQDGFSNMNDCAKWFEPSFLNNSARTLAATTQPGQKRHFMFYACPHRQRYLFGLGLEAIEEAILQGLLLEEQWDITFAGYDLQPLHLVNKVKPKLLKGLGWSRYVETIKNVDLGLSLMSAPHPGYPPLNLAAAGAVVVSNTFGIKRGLENYSNNIICVEPTVQSLVEALRTGERLATDRITRQRNLSGDGLLRDWQLSFSEVLDWLCERHAAFTP